MFRSRHISLDGSLSCVRVETNHFEPMFTSASSTSTTATNICCEIQATAEELQMAGLDHGGNKKDVTATCKQVCLQQAWQLSGHT